MAKRIDEFLAALRDELKGADSAIIQDAVSDAEEHLQTALYSAKQENPEIDDDAALVSIIEKYGTPEETASAYRKIEEYLTPTLSRSTTGERDAFLLRYFSVISDPKAWGAFLYMVISILTGFIYGMWIFLGVSFSLVTLILIIGLPITGLFLVSFRGMALIEGRIVEALLGVRMPRKPMFVRKGLGWVDKFKALVTESHTWKSMLYLFLMAPLGLLYFLVMCYLMALAVGAIAAPFFRMIFTLPFLEIKSGNHHIASWLLPFVAVAGFFLFAGTLHAAKFITKIHGRFAKTMLVRK